MDYFNENQKQMQIQKSDQFNDKINCVFNSKKGDQNGQKEEETTDISP